MSSRVKERLKKLMIELEHTDRVLLDRILEEYTGKTCDEAIELLPDEKVRELVRRIKKKKKIEVIA